MAWCPHCSDHRPTAASSSPLIGGKQGRKRTRFMSCSACGRVLKDKHSNSKSKFDDRSLLKTIAQHLPADDDDDIDLITDDALRLLRTALDKEELFSRGRRTRARVAAACLYISLRRHRKPYMLIDLSQFVKASVYVLGAVLVSVCRVLGIKDFDDADSCCFVDPSLFMHRISSRLLCSADASVVAATALRILSRARPRDWMMLMTSDRSRATETAIRTCGAALYIAATGNRRFSKSQILCAVRFEFATISGSGLTIEEFASRADQMMATAEEESSQELELICHHNKHNDRAHYCYGLCRECYDVFTEISQGCSDDENTKTTKTTKTKKKKRKLKDGEESLSDIADRDIDVYLNTETEKLYKTMVWDMMYKDYLDDQAAMKNASAAARTIRDGNKPGKEGKRRRGKDTREKPNKILSSRINYDALAQLCEEEGKEQMAETPVSNSTNKERVAGDGDFGDAEGEEYLGGDLGEDGDEGDYGEYFADDDDGIAQEHADDDFSFF